MGQYCVRGDLRTNHTADARVVERRDRGRGETPFSAHRPRQQTARETSAVIRGRKGAHRSGSWLRLTDRGWRTGRGSRPCLPCHWCPRRGFRRRALADCRAGRLVVDVVVDLRATNPLFGESGGSGRKTALFPVSRAGRCRGALASVRFSPAGEAAGFIGRDVDAGGRSQRGGRAPTGLLSRLRHRPRRYGTAGPGAPAVHPVAVSVRRPGG
jgi:hypothetical protein